MSGSSMSFHRGARQAIAAAAVVSLVCAGAATIGGSTASAAPEDQARLTEGHVKLRSSAAASGEGRSLRPLTPGTLGIPESGDYTFLVQLRTATVADSFAASRRAGARTAVAKRAALKQGDTIDAAQDRAISALPGQTPVLYRTQNALAGFAVSTDVSNAEALQALPGVEAVYPVAPKLADNSTAVPLQGALGVWSGIAGNTGEGISIGIIDTGIDYTHADFGGPGTTAPYAANAAAGATADPELFGPDAPQVLGGYDFAGDAYNADPTDPATYSPVPKPDANPLDCNGHGTHVAGSAAGIGVDADGVTYAGDYATTDFDSLRIGPGMAPGADLYALRVFGCDGASNLTSAAIDWAVDPNGDGDTSDHLDVINLSLGSSYGSPLDGDAVLVNAAADLGVLATVSAGNEGDIYDIGGSPGVAAKALTVASSVDSSDVVDSVTVANDGTPATYGASRSIAYDWATKPDLAGEVVQVSAVDTGCDPYSAADAATVAGKVVLLTWTQDNLECGSVARSTNVIAAGGIGFIFANSADSFTAGITGSAAIPGVLVTQSGADAIRAALTAEIPVPVVMVDATAANAFTLVDEDAVDSLSTFSSRGARGAGNLKPDVAAVGQGVFSAAVGTGDDGINFSGTSMAAPMTAGLAAMVLVAHPDWTPAQVKASIMNTAGQDLFVAGASDPTSLRYAPNRVGAGRIQAVPAVDNDVLAYVEEDPGAVSVSFGPVEVTGRTTLTKTVVVENTGSTSMRYVVDYDPITTVPGATYTLDRSQVTVPAGATRRILVTLDLRAKQLRKTVDPTHGVGEDLPLEFLADASGIIELTPRTAAPSLRVPVYSAPRPASTMTQPAAVTVDADGAGTLTLKGKGVGSASFNEVDTVSSIAAALELQDVSGLAPQCSTATPDLCVVTEADRPADIAYVGTAIDQGVDPADRMVYVGISAQAPASTPVGKVYYEVYLDVDDDLEPDLVAYTTTLTADADIFTVDLLDLATGEVIDTELLDNRFGDLDLAVFDSEVQLLPVWTEALAAYGVGVDDPRINYGVLSYSGSSGLLTDAAGFNSGLSALSGALALDTVTPGVAVIDDEGYGPLVFDQPGKVLSVTRNAASYADDKALGVMMVHFHNTAGTKTQIVSTGVQSITTLKAPTDPVEVGQPVTLQVDLRQQGGSRLPGGPVEVVDLATGEVVASGDAAVGSATLEWTPTETGDYTLRARYLGDRTFTPSGSGRAALSVTDLPVPPVPPVTPVTPATPVPPTEPLSPGWFGTRIYAQLTVSEGPAGDSTRVMIDLRDSGLVAPTGQMDLKVNGQIIRSKAFDDGRLRFTLAPWQQGTLRIRAFYGGDDLYAPGRSDWLVYTAT